VADRVLSRKTSHAVRTGRAASWIVASLLLSLAVPALAQVREVAVDGELFRKAANGTRLAELGLGSTVSVTGSEGSWAQIDLEGWVRSESLGATTRDGHDGVISTVGGAELRVTPSGAGAVSARLLQGFLLNRLEDRQGWTRVQRSGWVRNAALRVPTDPRAGIGSDQPAPDRPPPLVAAGRQLTTGQGSLEVRAAPGGDPVAQVESGTPITVVEQGNRWTRVRIEGWVRSDQLVTSDPDSVLVGVSAAALKASPDTYQGLRLRWVVQFVALQAAEPERTDFYEGEPFILARAPDAGDGMVYVAVPEELVATIEAVRPLQTIDILVQVRTGRSTLMGVPVLDLLAIF